MTDDVLDGIVGTRTSAAGLAGIPAPRTSPFAMEHGGAYPELQQQDAPTGSAVVTALAPLLAGGGLILHGMNVIRRA